MTAIDLAASLLSKAPSGVPAEPSLRRVEPRSRDRDGFGPRERQEDFSFALNSAAGVPGLVERMPEPGSSNARRSEASESGAPGSSNSASDAGASRHTGADASYGKEIRPATAPVAAQEARAQGQGADQIEVKPGGASVSLQKEMGGTSVTTDQSPAIAGQGMSGAANSASTTKDAMPSGNPAAVDAWDSLDGIARAIDLVAATRAHPGVGGGVSSQIGKGVSSAVPQHLDVHAEASTGYKGSGSAVDAGASPNIARVAGPAAMNLEIQPGRADVSPPMASHSHQPGDIAQQAQAGQDSLSMARLHSVLGSSEGASGTPSDHALGQTAQSALGRAGGEQLHTIASSTVDFHAPGSLAALDAPAGQFSFVDANSDAVRPSGEKAAVPAGAEAPPAMESKTQESRLAGVRTATSPLEVNTRDLAGSASHNRNPALPSSRVPGSQSGVPSAAASSGQSGGGSEIESGKTAAARAAGEGAASSASGTGAGSRTQSAGAGANENQASGPARSEMPVKGNAVDASEEIPIRGGATGQGRSAGSVVASGDEKSGAGRVSDRSDQTVARPTAAGTSAGAATTSQGQAANENQAYAAGVSETPAAGRGAQAASAASRAESSDGPGLANIQSTQGAAKSDGLSASPESRDLPARAAGHGLQGSSSADEGPSAANRATATELTASASTSAISGGPQEQSSGDNAGVGQSDRLAAVDSQATGAPARPGPLVHASPQMANDGASMQPLAASDSASSPRTIDVTEMPEFLPHTLKAAVRDGVREANIRLWPPELGAIKVHLQVHGSQVTARIQAERPDAYLLLDRMRGALQRGMQESGLTLQRLDIDLAGSASLRAASSSGASQQERDGDPYQRNAMDPGQGGRNGAPSSFSHENRDGASPQDGRGSGSSLQTQVVRSGRQEHASAAKRSSDAGGVDAWA